jgi:KRAB domain-containing zinc finger protein
MTPKLNDALKFKCDHCLKSYVSKKRIYCHIRMVYAEKKFSCVVCDKHFKTLTELRKHSLTHSSKKQFPCPKCDKKYRTTDGLRLHEQRFHLGIKFKCDLCGKTFTGKVSLKTHQKLIHKPGEVVRLECDFCKKIFRKAYLARHMTSVHLNLEKFVCDICNKPMKTKETLKKHKRTFHYIT